MGFSALVAAADLSVRGILGEQVTYAPGTGEPVKVNGVFDETYVVAQSGDSEVSTSGPGVFLTLSELPSDPEVDTAATVTIKGTQYKPHEVKPDGLGGVVLLLHQV